MFLISPFVGRILDWHKKQTGKDSYAPAEDPGVISVTRIYNYYKQHGYKTVVMGASFRNVGEILQLSGCDRLTISPALLEQLMSSTDPITCNLDPITAMTEYHQEKITITEDMFRLRMNEDAMATEKLAEGIRNVSFRRRLTTEMRNSCLMYC